MTIFGIDPFGWFAPPKPLPPLVDVVKPAPVLAPRPATPRLVANAWPSQSEAPTFYGDPALAGWLHENTMDIATPWKLDSAGSKILVHKKCADSLIRVLANVWEAMGHDQARIDAAGYNRFSGSYNFRPMRGGAHLSMHAYACAIDFDAAENEFHNVKHKFTANDPLVSAFERESWIWGGRWTSPDAMHFQAAHL